MERVCQECGKTFGEKCGACGNEEPKVIAQNPKRFQCPKVRCGRKWTQGDDHQSTGICPGCLPQAMARIRRAA